MNKQQWHHYKEQVSIAEQAIDMIARRALSEDDYHWFVDPYEHYPLYCTMQSQEQQIRSILTDEDKAYLLTIEDMNEAVKHADKVSFKNTRIDSIWGRLLQQGIRMDIGDFDNRLFAIWRQLKGYECPPTPGTLKEAIQDLPDNYRDSLRVVRDFVHMLEKEGIDFD